jgi:hypothetical protein
MQSKREDVGLKSDPVRANQIRFNKGQSKSIRNVILNSAPRALVLKAIEAAKKGVNAKMDAFIKAKGLAAAQNYTVGQLKTVGVDEAAILLRTGKDKIAELTLDDLVMLAADYKAIENGDANANELFELRDAKPAAATADLKLKLKAQVGRQETPASEVDATGDLRARHSVARDQVEATPKATDVIGKPGKMPFTYYTGGQTGEYFPHLDGDQRSCNCGPQGRVGTCVHVDAVERFMKGRDQGSGPWSHRTTRPTTGTPATTTTTCCATASSSTR